MVAKKNAPHTTVYLLGLIGILVLVYFSFTQFEQNQALKKYLENYNEENIRLTSQLEEANETIDRQEQRILELEEQVKNLSGRMSLVDDRIDQTKNALDDFEDEVEESTSWFKENSDIGNLFVYRSLRSSLKKCFRVEGGVCNIRIACIDLLHDKYTDFSYSYDEYTSNETDKLQSLEEFYHNKKGDCEDFSLLMKAELNNILDTCEDLGADEFIFEAVQPGSSRYFLDFDEEWYYDGTKAFTLPQDYDDFYVVCGNFPSGADPNLADSGVPSGHCALGFTDKKISTSNDIYSSLKDSIIIEPQTGFLTYDLRTEDTMLVPSFGDLIFDKDYYIWAVITDEDYYIFRDAEWRGYKDFITLAESLKEDLDTLK